MGYTTVILAGGLGTRLRPLTLVRPKPLIPLAGKTIIEHIIEWLRNKNYTRFIVVGKYLGGMLAEYLRRYSFIETYIVESKDTADAVRLVGDKIREDNILVSMGDVICNADFNKFMEYHVENNGIASIALKEVDNPLHYGLIILGRNNIIKLLVEKPASIELYVLSLAFSSGEKISKYARAANLVNTGFYAISRKVIDILVENPALMDWARHVFPYLIESGYKVYGWIMNRTAYWEDLGRINNYKKTLWDLLDKNIPGYTPKTKEVSPKTYIGKNSIVEGKIIPPVYIGENVVVEEDTIIGPYASLEDNVVVQKGVRVKYSIIWDNVEIGRESIVYDTIIMDNVVIRDNVTISSSIVGSKNIIGSNTSFLNKIIDPKIH